MNGRMGPAQSLVLRLYECLLGFYPPRFRREFSAEIRAVFLSRIREVEQRAGYAWLVLYLQEILGLVLSILKENWHELRVRKEAGMVPEDRLPKGGSGMRALRPAGTPGALWGTDWTLLTTAAIPASMLASPVLAALFLSLINLGVKAGFWPSGGTSQAEGLGFLASLALTLSLVQGFLLRHFLPRARSWALVTGAGIFLGGLATGAVIFGTSAQNWDGYLILAATLLPAGLALGLAQWLYLRRYLPNAQWIILIDVLAAGSILVAGRTFTNLVELAVFIFPGLITGLGLGLLLRPTQPGTAAPVEVEAARKDGRRLPRRVHIGLGLAALVPLFFGCSWAYAASQLALAKNAGVYPTVEQAILANSGQGFGGAKVVRIEDVRAQPNTRDALPHVWFGGATVYLDRVPAGHTWDHYQTGSFYLHVKDGWVHVGEGAFPEFIGWVMELYHMEGAGR
ncbi:MAG TPA: hypothetical protein PJ988_11545 [Anaerolinea sp.]|nr:hypothetical protein [Anaerolinea sp.]